MSITPVVADMNHNNALNLSKMKAAGLWGIIHKAVQGTGFTDDQYTRRRAAAEELGFLWGAYAFATGDNVKAHVEHFFAIAQPGPKTLMCLDFEDNPHSQMSGAQAREFLDRADQKLGRPCWIYGGNRINEQITDHDPWWTAHPLWLCQYKTSAALRDASLQVLSQHITVPKPWKTYTLLQYTGDGIGPRPHTVAGLEDGADLNAFAGSRAELEAVWATPSPPAAQGVA